MPQIVSIESEINFFDIELHLTRSSYRVSIERNERNKTIRHYEKKRTNSALYKNKQRYNLENGQHFSPNLGTIDTFVLRKHVLPTSSAMV